MSFSKWVDATTYCLRAALEVGRVGKRIKVTIDHEIDTICSVFYEKSDESCSDMAIAPLLQDSCLEKPMGEGA